MLDPVDFGKAMASIVKEALAPLAKRIEELDARQPEKGEKGDPGQDAPPVEIDVAEVVRELLAADGIKQLVALEVDAFMEEHPAPAGRDGAPGKDGDPGPKGEPGRDGEKGADGIGLAGAVIDRNGELVVTLTNGEAKALGPVVGKDGAKGADGADFTDCTLEWDGDRTLVARGKGGEIRKTMPIPMDRGYWREGMACEKGDILTHDGNAWIALRDCKSKPCYENKEDWRLFARKGRDGRDGKDGKPPPGPVSLKGDDDA